MGEIFFTSFLDQKYQDDLERIFYFNENQEKVHDAVLLAMDRYGTPCISNAKNRLWMTFESGVQSQSLFVMEKSKAAAELVGVVVYTREEDSLIVIFAAVREDYAYGGVRSNKMVLLRMIDEVRSIAHHIKGITSLTLFLHGATVSRISIR